MKAIGYVRVSTREQGNKRNGLDGQELAIGQFCTQNGFTLESIYSDIASGNSGLEKRAGLAAAIAYCKANDCLLIVAKLDRFSRSVQFISTMMNNFSKAKITLFCVDLGTNVDSFMFHLYAALAQKERELISVRTKAGLAAAKARGVVLGSPTARITVAKLNDTQRQGAKDFIKSLLPVIEPLQRAGHTQKFIIEHLNRHQIKTSKGNNWTVQGLSKALKRL